MEKLTYFVHFCVIFFISSVFSSTATAIDVEPSEKLKFESHWKYQEQSTKYIIEKVLSLFLRILFFIVLASSVLYMIDSLNIFLERFEYELGNVSFRFSLSAQ